MRQSIFSGVIILLLIQQANAQHCAFDEKHRALMDSLPEFRQKVAVMEEEIYRLSLAHYQRTMHVRSKPNYTIPVVVHLIIPPGDPVGQGNHLTDRQVEQGLDYLNQAFSNSGPFAAVNGVDVGIQFCLARRDPLGQPTNGITRTFSNLVNEMMCNPGTNSANDGAIKALVGWDCSRYVNIYLVTDLFNNNFGCSLAGYAYFPGAPCSVDGIVQESRYWNSVGGTVVTAHEMGHFFSLNHTFNGGCTNNNCLLDGDRVCDTPPDNSASFAPCNTNSCNSDTPDLPDDNTNYMDYSSCSPVHFTDGQRVRMVAALETTRKSLIASNGCLPPGDYDAVALDLRFTHSVCTDTLCAQLQMRNDGIKSFSSIVINYQIDGIVQPPFAWNGMLIPGQSLWMSLPCQPIAKGMHTLNVQLGQPDSQSDFYPQNNSISYSFEIFDELKLTIDSIQPTHCISDGKLWAHATGGKGPYTYRLMNRSGAQTDPYFQLLLPGVDVLKLQDVNQCQASIPFTVPDSCTSTANKKFVTNGNARPLGKDCYLLTEEIQGQAGSVWYEDKVSLYNSFDIYFDMNLGCLDGPGADGIAFVFQPISTSIGTGGGGLGYQGIVPSLAVEFDTYQNGNYLDPPFDHVSVMRNGNVDHGNPDNLVGPVGILNGNVNAEDCRFHKVLIRWMATNATLEVYVDCALRLRYSGNVVKDIFRNDPNVYFGFTAATGGSINVQQICLNYITGVSQLPDYTICEGESIQVNAKQNFARYRWRPSNGVSDTTVFNPVIRPDSTTTYHIFYKDACGFDYEDSLTVFVKRYRLNYALRLLDSCGSFKGALLQILEGPQDTAAKYSNNGVDFYKQLYFEIPDEGVYTFYAKIGNCILPEIVEVSDFTNRLRDSLLRVEAVNCKDSGRILITGLQGIPPYAYRLNGGPWKPDGLFTGLQPGNYTLETKDSTSCIVKRMVDVTIAKQTLNLKQDSARLEISCCQPNAYIAITASGTDPFYHYSLDQGHWEDQGYFNALSAGFHELVARDEYGCLSDTLRFFVTDHSQAFRDTQSFRICQGDYVQVGTQQYRSTGIYTDVFSNVHCCDSIIVTKLTVDPVYAQNNVQVICEGDSIRVGNKHYLKTGQYIDTLQSIQSCDSVINTDLLVHPVYNQQQKHVLCDGAMHRVGTHVYTKTGNYTDTLSTVNGCDSVILTDLTVHPKHFTQQAFSICKGKTIQVGTNQYMATGLYTDLLQNQFGCDSLVETRLLVDTVEAVLQLDTIVCYGDDNAFIHVQPSSGIPGFMFALDDPLTYSTQTDYGPLAPGNFRVFVKDSLQCEAEYQVAFIEAQLLTADLPLELKLTLGDRVQLQPVLNFSPATVLWTPAIGLSCDDCLNPSLQALQNTRYEVFITNKAGCPISASIQLVVDNQTDVFVPNAFSPNGDQLNDQLTVFGGASIKHIALLRIFDRWGNLVFENKNFQINDLQAGWDGQFKGSRCMPATYVYYLKAIRLDDTVIEKSGDVLLVR